MCSSSELEPLQGPARSLFEQAPRDAIGLVQPTRRNRRDRLQHALVMFALACFVGCRDVLLEAVHARTRSDRERLFLGKEVEVARIALVGDAAQPLMRRLRASDAANPGGEERRREREADHLRPASAAISSSESGRAYNLSSSTMPR